MKKLVLAVFAIGVFSICSASVSAQTVTRIQFARGARSAVVTGTLRSYKSQKRFVIRVRRGQTLTTENAGENHITVDVEAPKGSHYEQDMAADCHDRNEVSPTAAGDYRITVTECMKADAFRGTFRLRVRVH